MKRWLFHVVTAVSFLLSLAAAIAWATSHTRPLDWHLLGIAHSPDLTRGPRTEATSITMMPADGSNVDHGFWDALWVRSHSGRLTLVAQTIDYDRNLHAVRSTPPSLTVDVSGPSSARIVVFDRLPDSSPWAGRLGFAWDTDAQQAVDASVDVRARRILLPYWFLLLLGLPLSLTWWRVQRGRGSQLQQ